MVGVEPTRHTPRDFKSLPFTNLGTPPIRNHMKVSIEQLREAVNSSQSMREAASKLPINFKTFRKYAKELGIYKTNQSGQGTSKPQPKIDIDDILAGKHPQYHTYTLKNRLIIEKGWEHKCSCCKNTEWNNLLIPIELDHIDGNPYNHEKDNLRFLCPNCHAQTPTYRNKRRD